MAVAGLVKLWGTTLEEHGHDDEHINSERLVTKPSARDTTEVWLEMGSSKLLQAA